MSLLIKGMEMPIQCLSCPLWKLIHVKGIWKDYCGASNCIIKDVYSKPDWCPLVEVPPHGRLIDYDEVFRKLKMHSFINPSRRECIDNDACALERWLSIVPTIIEAENETI